MKPKVKNLLIFGFFLFLSILMTYPQVKNLASGVRDVGDPLLNSWILAWNAQKMITLDFSRYFDANIFYPYRKTLAYSEHLFPQSLIALPIYLASANPILAHNIILLLAFATSGFGMYLFAFYFTKNHLAGLMAGIIFAFSPFMFAHFPHLQVLCAGGIPVTLLFLHKFFLSESCRDLLLFTFFYVVQILANGYYAAYLTLFAALFILISIVAKKKLFNIRFLIKLGLSATLVVILVGPFFYQYVQVRKELGFSREPGYSAKFHNFLAAPPMNRIYGKLTERWRTPEGELFPGMIAVFLGFLGFFSAIRIKKPRTDDQSQNVHRVLFKIKIILNCLIFLWLIIIILLIVSGGFDLSFGSLTLISLHQLKNPLFTLAFLLIIRLLLATFYKSRIPKFKVEGEKSVLIYAAVFLLSFLLTFGLRGPYYFLYNFVPGFDGLRVVSRIHIFVMLSLAVLAAHGVRWLSTELGRKLKSIALSLLPLFILAEYFSVPIPLIKMPIGKDLPEVYQWLASRKGEDIAIVEIPFPPSLDLVAEMECPRMYYSTYHWAKTVNGFSGYLSPLYEELRSRWPKIPLQLNIKALKEIKVRLLLFRPLFYDEETEKEILQEFGRLEQDIRLVHYFEPVYVFELIYTPEEEEQLLQRQKRQRIPLTDVVVDANVDRDMVKQAIDGSLETRWNGGLQRKGCFFQVDLGNPRIIRGLSLLLGPDVRDYPRGYSIEISRNGIDWIEVTRTDRAQVSLTAFLKPKEFPFDIFFPPVEARHVKITLIVEDLIHHWSIRELIVYE